MNAQTQWNGISGCHNVNTVVYSGLPRTTWVTYTKHNFSMPLQRRGFSITYPIFDNAPLNKKYPVVIFNHGDGNVLSTIQLITNLHSKSQVNNVDDRFILVCTQAGTDLMGDRFYADKIKPHNDIRRPLTFYNRANVGNVSLITNSVNEEIIYLNTVVKMLQNNITARNIVDPDRIYMVGYSGGAALTQIAATKLNNSVAAFASIAGHKSNLIDNNFKNGQNFIVPMLLINASTDNNIGFTDAEATTKEMYSVGHEKTRNFWMDVNRVTFKTPNNYSVVNLTNNSENNTNVLQYNIKNRTQHFNHNWPVNINRDVTHFKYFLIQGGGHHWHMPNGFAFDDPDLDLNQNKLCKKINTTDEVWNFFRNHKKSLNGPIPTLAVAKTASTNLFDDTELLTENSNNVLVYNSQDNNNLTVELNNFKSANYTFSILNMNGSIVKKEVINSTNEKLFELNLDISEISKGIYLLQISNENEVIEVKKFIK